MNLKPYKSPAKAHGNEEYRRFCPKCRTRLHYSRKNREQLFGGAEILEWDKIVYLKCKCGNLIRTRFKPMSAYMSEEKARSEGLIP